jgi:hypothetical protein
MRNRPLLRARPAFTLAEVVVSTVILVVAAAVVVPYLAAQNRRKQAEDTRAILFSLSMSLNTPHACVVVQAPQCPVAAAPNRTVSYSGFMERVNGGGTFKYPQQLHNLTTKILLTEKSCIGALYVAADTTAWNPVGAAPGASSQWPPYSGLTIVAGKGVLTPMGWVHDSVLKSASGTPSIPGWVEVVIDSLSLDDVQELDLAIDGGFPTPPGLPSGTTGLLRYAANGSYQRARFLISAPVNGAVTRGC